MIDTMSSERTWLPDVRDAQYIAWSHDGSKLVVATTTGEVRVLDIATGTLVTRATGLEKKPPLWSPDDARLLVGGVILTLDGARIDLPSQAVHPMWTPGGRIVQVPSGDNVLCLSCTADGACFKPFCSSMSPEGDVYTVARPIGYSEHVAMDYVRTSDDQLLATIDCSTETWRQDNDHPWSARSVHVVGCPYDKTLRFFDASTGTVTSLSNGSGVWGWSPSGEYLATAREVIRMSDYARTSLLTASGFSAWSPNNKYWIAWTLPDTGDILDFSPWAFGLSGTQTPVKLQQSVIDPAPAVFSGSGESFALLQYSTASVCDSTSFTCTYAGEGEPYWLDDDRYLLLRPDTGLALGDRATGVAESLAVGVTAVAVRPR